MICQSSSFFGENVTQHLNTGIPESMIHDKIYDEISGGVYLTRQIRHLWKHGKEHSIGVFMNIQADDIVTVHQKYCRTGNYVDKTNNQ